MALEVTGKLYERFETQHVTERFNKRELVVELGGRHPQLVLFQLTGKRCADLDGFHDGDPVRIEFALRGREWTSRQGEVKYWSSLEVLKLEAAPGEPGGPDASRPEPEDSGDVPF